MILARLTVGWTVMFVWGWAYMMPAVPTFMFVVWIYAKRTAAIKQTIVGAGIVWLAYAVME